MKRIRELLRREDGQGMTEYIVILAFVAVAAIGVTSMFGDNVRKIYATAVDSLAGKATKDTGAKTAGKTGAERGIQDFASEAKKH
jgi:Flp pilus assembly pilin Flp